MKLKLAIDDVFAVGSLRAGDFIKSWSLGSTW